MRHMRTDLVRAPGQKLDLKQRALLPLGDHSVARNDLLGAARRIFIKNRHLLFLFIL